MNGSARSDASHSELPLGGTRELRGDDVTRHVPAVELKGVEKAFGHVVALKGVDLHVDSGEILALCGDNGAGKSTLIKIISGVYRADGGEIRIDGELVVDLSPGAAQALGIATVFQDLALIDQLSVTDNMYMGRPETRARYFTNGPKMASDSAATLRTLGISVPSVQIPIGMLSGGQRQAVAIARAVHRRGQVFLLDEPTAALGVRETAHVVDIILDLRSQGRAIVLISHDMELVFALADRIEVLRQGRVRGVLDRAETTKAEIVGLITGASDVAGDDR